MTTLQKIPHLYCKGFLNLWCAILTHLAADLKLILRQ